MIALGTARIGVSCFPRFEQNFSRDPQSRSPFSLFQFGGFQLRCPPKPYVVGCCRYLPNIEPTLPHYWKRNTLIVQLYGISPATALTQFLNCEHPRDIQRRFATLVSCYVGLRLRSTRYMPRRVPIPETSLDSRPYRGCATAA